MKYVVPIIFLSAVISACGSDEPSVAEAKAVQPNPEIEGLWVSSEAYDTSYPTDRYIIPSDELLYFDFIGATDNPIEAHSYVHSEVENCFLHDSDNVTHIGKNQYRDTFNDVMELTTSNGKLVFEFEFEGSTLAAEFSKVTEFSSQDIAICNSNSALQNDDTADSIFTPIVSLFD